jgi:SAM-dependent methyltransferase
MRLLDLQALERSSVVANCAMNRERRLTGPNSYERELGIDISAFLQGRSHTDSVIWADLCCGSGRALIDAAAEFTRNGNTASIQIEGIDLAGLFDPNPFPDLLLLCEQTVEAWEPTGSYALVTCVHGLHYLGDKLAAIAKATSSLSSEGLLVANLDLASFRNADGQPAGRQIAARLRGNGLTYDARRRVVRCEGGREVAFGLRYLGADDAAGPNYTGQPAVASYYAE